MIENQSKRGKMDYQLGPDFLSDLPMSIIHIILALVPLRDAVKTSILSRQWRYTWASLPQLTFEEHLGSRNYKLRCKFEDRVKNFITHALYHHQGPINRFKMSVSFQIFRPYVHVWVLRLSRKDIREMILDMGYSDYSNCLHLHSSIYSCTKLTYLDLFRCELDPPPCTFKGFLFLRHLSLQEVALSGNGIETLVANSPLLEKLVLVKSRVSELIIHAPSLKHLYLVGDYNEICLYAPLLAVMDVALTSDDFTAHHQQQKSSVCNYTKFIGGFTCLEKLRGLRHFTKFLSIKTDHHSSLFHRLKDIELEHVNFRDRKVISAVARLIISAPNLHKLEISTNFSTGEDDDALEALHVSFRDFGCASDFAFEKLRVVNIDGVCGLPAKVGFIKFLLECSPVLERMKLDMYGGIPTEEKQKLMAELMGFARASPNTKLLISDT